MPVPPSTSIFRSRFHAKTPSRKEEVSSGMNFLADFWGSLLRRVYSKAAGEENLLALRIRVFA
jgi:hypothetical protein